MTSLGMKIVGSEFEAGFTAGTREEFDSFIVRLTLMADSVWPKADKGLGAENLPQSEWSAERYAYEAARQKDITAGLISTWGQEAVSTKWREDQGLR